MSLTVTCQDCRNPNNPRLIVQWRQGNCSDCANECVARHLAEFPEHRVELSGSVSDTPFGVGDSAANIRRLFGRRAS